jgi:serine/threonine protein kinase/Tol biopolymer transport system component
MTPERWQEVERIYQAVLDLEPSGRSTFLHQTCAGDEELRREVVSLLKAHKPDDPFLESPALEVAARALADEVPRLARGQHLGSYELIAPLGAGGMGEVWRARDPALNRQVAIKLLPSQYSRDAERLRRFEQEARAAGMLNHPNLLAIYAIGKEEGSPYLVTELLEGTTLRERFAVGGLPEGKAVEYAEQIAQGLAAAHDKGIVHRDLKPENIFITRDGRVKILDFGLAKLVQTGPEQQNQAQTETAPGMVLGTPAYMSPEQVQGQKADRRSDIFALGAVLYEMLAGRRPFAGDTSVETMNAILKQDAPPIAQASPLVEQIVRHCLEKDPEERFQSARDLGFHLRMARHPSAKTPVASSAKIWRRYFATAIIALALVGATAGVTWWLTRPAPPNAGPIFTRLTSDSGLTTDPALSLDGKWLAYASDRSGEGNLDIWLQQVGKGEALRLTTDPADDREPAFSPDGTTIAFRSDRDGGIYIVSTLGGAAKKIAAQGRRPRFSPDGSWIAYYWGGGSDFSFTDSRSYVVSATGGTPRQLQPEFAVACFPVWSPDGKHVLFLGSREPIELPAESYDWWVAPLNTGTTVRTGAVAVLRKHGLPDAASRSIAPGVVLIPREWTAKGRVVFTADLGDSRNVWQLAISPMNWRVTGSPQRLTFGAGTEDLPSTAGGNRMVFSNLTANVDIWSLPIDHREGVATGELARLTENPSVDVQPAISADGRRLVFASNRAGNSDVWAKNLRTGEETAITLSPVFESRPAITADGSKVAYNDWEGGKPKVNIASLDGVHSEDALPAKVCDDCFLAWDWSPDSRTLLYWSRDQRQVGVLDIASREKAIVLKHPEYALLRSHFSPSGRWIAFHAITGPNRVQLYIAPFQGMSPITQDMWIAGTDRAGFDVPRWSPDSNSLYLISDRDGYLCLWRQRLDPETKRPLGEAKPVYHLHGARRSISSVPVSYLEISVARDKIVFPMGERTGNIWMAEWKPERF